MKVVQTIVGLAFSIIICEASQYGVDPETMKQAADELKTVGETNGESAKTTLAEKDQTSTTSAKTTSQPSTFLWSLWMQHPQNKSTPRPTSTPTLRPTSKPTLRPSSKPNPSPTGSPTGEPTADLLLINPIHIEDKDSKEMDRQKEGNEDRDDEVRDESHQTGSLTGEMKDPLSQVVPTLPPEVKVVTRDETPSTDVSRDKPSSKNGGERSKNGTNCAEKRARKGEKEDTKGESKDDTKSVLDDCFDGDSFGASKNLYEVSVGRRDRETRKAALAYLKGALVGAYIAIQ